MMSDHVESPNSCFVYNYQSSSICKVLKTYLTASYTITCNYRCQEPIPDSSSICYGLHITTKLCHTAVWQTNVYVLNNAPNCGQSRHIFLHSASTPHPSESIPSQKPFHHTQVATLSSRTSDHVEPYRHMLLIIWYMFNDDVYAAWRSFAWSASLSPSHSDALVVRPIYHEHNSLCLCAQMLGATRSGGLALCRP